MKIIFESSDTVVKRRKMLEILSLSDCCPSSIGLHDLKRCRGVLDPHKNTCRDCWESCGIIKEVE